MKFTIDRDALKNVMPTLARVAKGNRIHPMLSHVRVGASDIGVELTSTDLETAVRFTVTAEIETQGLVLINAEKLAQIVSTAPAGLILIESDENRRAHVTTGAAKYIISGLSPNEYPAMGFDCEDSVTVDGAQFARAIESVGFAASRDASRFNLNAVQIVPTDAGSRLTATDGHRLARCTSPVKLFEEHILVPMSGIAQLARALERQGEVRIGSLNRTLLLATETMAMSVRLIDGDYPNADRVIPSGEPRAITTVSRSDILAALERVTVFTSDKNKGITMNVGRDSAELLAVHPDLGSANDSVQVESTGEWQAIVNSVYLHDALDAFREDTVQIEWHGDGSPMVLRAPGNESYFNLVMPMRN